MKVQYIDYKSRELKIVECVQVVFTLDKDNLVCFRSEKESIDGALKIPKSDVQIIF